MPGIIRARPSTLAAIPLLAACAVHCGPPPGPGAAVSRQQQSAAPGAPGVAGAEAKGPRRSPPLSLRDREAWRAVLEWPDSCEDAFRSSRAGQDGGVVFTELEPGLSVVEVVCAAGAYQPSSMFIRLDERDSSPVAVLLEFSVYRSPDGTSLELSSDQELWGEPFLSPGTKELSVLALSRQLADCGIWSKYTVATERPSLVAAAVRLPCPATPGPPAESADGHAPPGWQPIRLTK